MGNPAPPQCIGIILDGNRRWAKERGLPKLEGHRAGLVDTLKHAVVWVRDRHIPHLAVFMFSTENWNREAAEVSYLMDLFRESLATHLRALAREGVRIRFAGDRTRFSADMQEAMRAVESETENNDKVTLWACLSYGGRADIVQAAEAARLSGEPVTAELLGQKLWTAGMPDPDIIIRTGGEKRLSGFLLWQSAYSELFFIDAYWPDFSETHLDAILAEYARRERRMGK